MVYKKDLYGQSFYVFMIKSYLSEDFLYLGVFKFRFCASKLVHAPNQYFFTKGVSCSVCTQLMKFYASSEQIPFNFKEFNLRKSFKRLVE